MLKLNDVMEFDCPVVIDSDGEVSQSSEYAPEVYWSSLDGEESDAVMMEYLARQGWVCLSGYTGQYGYRGPVMHASEFVGGAMERDILDNPGVYVLLVVEDIEEDGGEPVGWIVASKENE